MIDVVSCIAFDHDPRLLALAILVALIGSTVTMQLFGRVRLAEGRIRAGWIVLTAIATGTMVWCTHFVAMLAFHSALPVTLDPLLTLASIAVAILLAVPSIGLAASPRTGRGLAGGALAGLSITAMHYTGMAAYRVDGIIIWDDGYVVASIGLSLLLATAAFRVAHGSGVGRRVAASLLLGAAIASLHFTGMTAMKIAVMNLHGASGLSASERIALAAATACAALIAVGCGAVCALIDGEIQSHAHQRLRRLALHDGLTDLPNRMCFHEELTVRLHRKDGQPHLAVIMLDLSRFKAVNDTYGHQAGDQLLVALAARLAERLQGAEFISRLGGDEFAALISYAAPGELDDFLARLADAFVTPFLFERFSASVAANIGVSLAPQDGDDTDTLLARADLAMYRAKTEHSPKPCFYDPMMDEAVRDRRELVGELRQAIAVGAFELHYQVQVATRTGDISGYEALIRWHHPTRGTIPPAEFIPLAESMGEIIPLSEWVLNQACGEASQWPNRHSVSVNLSALHLSDPGLVDTVRRALDASGLPANRLVLELTEGAIIRDRNYALRQLTALKAMGVGLALDDFGVGYSSLDVLRSFSFDRIKLDASFMAEISKNEQAVAILRSVTALGTTLDIPVLAEGIEDPVQLRIATEEGCSAIQGYFIGRPGRSLVDPDRVRTTVQSATEGEPIITLAA